MTLDETFKKNDINHKLAIRTLIINILKMLLITIICGLIAFVVIIAIYFFIDQSTPPNVIIAITVPSFLLLVADAIVFMILILNYIVRTIKYMQMINDWVVNKGKDGN